MHRCMTAEIAQEVLDGLDSDTMNDINENFNTTDIKVGMKV